MKAPTKRPTKVSSSGHLSCVQLFCSSTISGSFKLKSEKHRAREPRNPTHELTKVLTRVLTKMHTGVHTKMSTEIPTKVEDTVGTKIVADPDK